MYDKIDKESDRMNLVDSLNDSDYVVRYARSHYIFSKNGEEVIILPENK